MQPPTLNSYRAPDSSVLIKLSQLGWISYSLPLGIDISEPVLHNIKHIQIRKSAVSPLNFIGVVNIIAYNKIYEYAHVKILIAELVVPSSYKIRVGISYNRSVVVGCNYSIRYSIWTTDIFPP